MVQLIKAKTMLSPVKEGTDTWFGLRYNMNLYRGCPHGCIYCDSRSNCYQLGDIANIRIKENALELLEKELKSKREKGTIGFGSMNDPYMPVEKEENLTRKALLLVKKYRFPVHIITKSDLVSRDIDLLQEISEIYAAVSFTITTTDDSLSQIIEPGAPPSSKRFKAMRKLSDAGIYTGLTLMPVLPFISDSFQNLEKLIVLAKESGAQYILISTGMTLREGQREYFFNQLDIHFPGLKDKYIQMYGNSYNCNVPDADNLFYKVKTLCYSVSLPMKMNFYKPVLTQQLKLF